jgi:hypothetical protein
MSKTKKETGEDKKLHGVKHKISKKNRTIEGNTFPEEYTEKQSNLKPGDKKKKNKQK